MDPSLLLSPKISGGTGYGFVVADPEENWDSDLSVKYNYYIANWGQQMYKAFSKTDILPNGQAKEILRSCPDNGYLFLRMMHNLLNPNIMEIPSIVCNQIPVQGGKSFEDYVSRVKFHHSMLGLVQDISTSFGNKHVQDMFISNMDNSSLYITCYLL